MVEPVETTKKCNMTDFSWKAPDLTFIQQLSSLLKNRRESGCDISPVNLFLYSHKYNTKVCVKDNWLFRVYSEYDCIYYGFPIPLSKENTTPESLKNALMFIKKDADTLNTIPQIFFATENHIKMLYQIESLPCTITIEKDRDLADYIYSQEKLANLPGSKLQKKRNHINQFIKKHPDAQYIPLTKDNISLALEVEDKWLDSYKTDSFDLVQEKSLIELALNNFEELGLCGGLCVCENKPVAMCIASVTNENTTNVHFEKAIDPFAKDGAYAFINQNFSITCSTPLINREEDLGLENLRKAKESYHPEYLLEKYKISIK